MERGRNRAIPGPRDLIWWVYAGFSSRSAKLARNVANAVRRSDKVGSILNHASPQFIENPQIVRDCERSIDLAMQLSGSRINALAFLGIFKCLQ
jgi:hypothetical protein